MSLAKVENQKIILTKSPLAYISEVMSSVAAVDVAQESFMELGIYLHRTSAVIMELQGIQNPPPNITEILKSLCEKVEQAKDLVEKNSKEATSITTDELKDIVAQLEGVTRDIGEDLSNIPSSIFVDRTYVEIAVRSLSKEMTSAHFHVNGIQQYDIDAQRKGMPSTALVEKHDETSSVASSSEENKEHCSHHVDISLAHYIQDMNHSTEGNDSQIFVTLPHFAEYLEPIYNTFFCPLTKKVMEDPVIIDSGVTYEREAIAEWLQTSRDLICPQTKMALRSSVFITNKALRDTIQEWKERNEATRIKVARTALSLASSEAMVLEAMRDLQLLGQKRTQNKEQMHKTGVTGVVANFIENENRTVRLEALNLLCLLVEDEEGKVIVAKTKVLRRTVKMLSSKHSSERHASISLLLNLSKSDTLLEFIGSTAGCILMLITMMYNEFADPFAAKKAGETLKNLEKFPKNIKSMADNGFLEPLLDHLLDGSEEMQMEMVSYLGEIFLEDDMKSYVAKRGSQALIKMINSDNTLTRKAALKALAQISSHRPNSEILVDAGVVPIMVEEIFARRIHNEPTDSKEEATAILANLMKSEIDLEAIRVSTRGHTFTSHYFMFNTAHLLKGSMSDGLNLHLIKILLSLSKLPEHQETVVSVIKETEASPKILELLNSPLEELNIVAAKLLITLSSHIGHTIAEGLCKMQGQPGGLVMSYSTNEITEKHAVLVNLVAQLPNHNLTLNQALLHQGTVRVILDRIEEILRGTKTIRCARHYLEGLVGILVRFTTTVFDQEILQMAMERSLASVFTELLSRTAGSDEVQRLAAVGLGNLSANTVHLSKPPELKHSKSRGFLHKNINLNPQREGRRAHEVHLCPVHRGVCSPCATFCLWESRAVEGLMGCLEHDNPKVVEAGLSAISTLLDERVDVEKSVGMLCEAGAVTRVLRVLKEHREEDLLERSLWMIEAFLMNGGQLCSSEILSDKMLPPAVVNAFHRGNSGTKQVAGNILRYMNRMPQFSHTLSFEK